MEVTKNFARFRVLHQVDDGSLASGHEYGSVAVQSFLEHRSRSADLVYSGVIRPEGFSSLVSSLVAAKMNYRVRSLIDIRLGTVRCCENDVIASLDQCHHWNYGFVEIIAGRSRAAALHLDTGGIGTDHKNFTFRHRTSPFPFGSFRNLSCDSPATMILQFHLHGMKAWSGQSLSRLRNFQGNDESLRIFSRNCLG